MHDQTGIPGHPAAEAPPTPPPPPEPRQRWRLVVGRSAVVADQTQRDVAEAWEAAIAAAALPVAHGTDARARPRIAFGAPLPVGMAANGELIDVVLTERWPAWRVREALTPHVPAGWQLLELHDVWLAGPALGGRVAAADHQVVLVGAAGIDAARLGEACAMLLSARRVPRERRKGDGTVTYDLRPLVVDVRLVSDGPPPVLVTRTRIHPELGTGRPEEVVAALGDIIGERLQVESIVRDRLVLLEDLDLD
ncbi:MAG: DUF2344 domain-containing protein [Candidatus Limnocylindrales bacterium]